MSQELLLADTLLRGMTIGAQMLIAIAFLRPWPPRLVRGLGAAFVISAGCYIANSSMSLMEALGPAGTPIGILSIISPVIFWQFAMALFDDRFQIRPLTMLPYLLVAPIVVFHFSGVTGVPLDLSLIVARVVMILAFGHAMFVALRYLNDDLIEGRRRFRLVFAVAVAITGFIINYAETVSFREEAPAWILMVQAVAILIMTMIFGVWLLGMREGVLEGAGKMTALNEGGEAAQNLRAADRPAYAKLMALMDEGVWMDGALSVAGLAEKVGIPEHQLRVLINGQLGHRNFSAFLNTYRIEAAKSRLIDPAQARRQIIQIALDVGFGSIAPFNRAFKEATGVTPTEFRKNSISAS